MRQCYHKHRVRSGNPDLWKCAIKLKGGGWMEAVGKDLPKERKENRPERNQKRGRREWQIFSKIKYRKKPK